MEKMLHLVGDLFEITF